MKFGLIQAQDLIVLIKNGNQCIMAFVFLKIKVLRKL